LSKNFGTKLKKFLTNVICWFMPTKQLRRRFRYGFFRRNLVIIENGKERRPRLFELPNVIVNDTDKSCVVKVELPQQKHFALDVLFSNTKDSVIVFHKGCLGEWHIDCHERSNYVDIGQDSVTTGVTMILVGNIVKLGKGSFISAGCRIWGDGHSVLSLETGEVLNKPVLASSYEEAMKSDNPGTISLGDNVWVGERVTLTKGAQVPANCVVGIAAVVTKKFTEENCVIAGVPAAVRKRGIFWDKPTPIAMDAIVQAKKKKSNK